MKRAVAALALLLVSAPWLVAQESKPVPKDSLRVSIPGCSKNSIFIAGRRTADQPGSVDVQEGMRFHMNGPKAIMADIKKRQGSMIEITGLVRKGQLAPEGLKLGGVTISPGQPPSPGGGTAGVPVAQQVQIDVESWRQISGQCRSK